MTHLELGRAFKQWADAGVSQPRVPKSGAEQDDVASHRGGRFQPTESRATAEETEQAAPQAGAWIFSPKTTRDAASPWEKVDDKYEGMYYFNRKTREKTDEEPIEFAERVTQGNIAKHYVHLRRARKELALLVYKEGNNPEAALRAFAESVGKKGDIRKGVTFGAGGEIKEIDWSRTEGSSEDGGLAGVLPGGGLMMPKLEKLSLANNGNLRGTAMCIINEPPLP